MPGIQDLFQRSLDQGLFAAFRFVSGQPNQKNKNKNIVHLLIKYGANPNFKNVWDVSVMDYANKLESKEIYHFLQK